LKIGDRIKHRRIELGMSQDELARRLGYRSRSSINKIEKDASGLPQTKIAAIASVLQTTPSYIMGWEEVQKNNDTITDAIVRMRTDDDFLSVVDCLLTLDADKLSIIKQTASAFKK
jgi:transcriptional regulator with XRE-family HTH domain